MSAIDLKNRFLIFRSVRKYSMTIPNLRASRKPDNQRINHILAALINSNPREAPWEFILEALVLKNSKNGGPKWINTDGNTVAALPRMIEHSEMNDEMFDWIEWANDWIKLSGPESTVSSGCSWFSSTFLDDIEGL